MAQPNAAVNGIGDMATQFIAPQGGFDQTHKKYTPGSAYVFPDNVLNAQVALQNASAFGAPLPQGMGMMAGLLPAALKIEEHKKMNEIAENYYAKYIKDFNKKYGFKDEDIKTLVSEFEEVTEEICNLIPDKAMKDMYRKYIQSYPTMYLSMIPAEALQTKLAVKCVSDNNNLRKKVEEMSSCVSSLVKNLTELQISAGIPPIVNLMFESMPDPLTAMTDPMYHKYNDSIVTYHKLLQDTQKEAVPLLGNVVNDPTATSALTNGDILRQQPLQILKHLVGTSATAGHTTSDPNVTLTQAELKDLKSVMENMQTQSGCQPFGDEWNHTGPTPPMNPAMCLGDGENFQPGNPRHDLGRTTLYQAKRDKSGQAHWQESGNMPALAGGQTQFVQPQQHAVQYPDPYAGAGMGYMPRVDKRPMQQQPMQMQMQMPAQHIPQPQQFHNEQAFAQPYEMVPHNPKGSNSKAKKKVSSRGTKNSKGSKGGKRTPVK